MGRYIVTWEIEVEAENERDAEQYCEDNIFVLPEYPPVRVAQIRTMGVEVARADRLDPTR